MKHSVHTERTVRQSKEEHWNYHIENWQQSGITQVEYCQKNDLNKHTFQYWKKKRSQTEKIRPLLPVSILNETFSATSSYSGGLSLSVSNRFDVNINIGFDSETLSRLINLLERV